ARLAVEETGLGRVEDKIIKNELAAKLTPGIEDLPVRVLSGDTGLMVIEGAPYGVICAITPCTNPVATITSNAIAMTAAGNSVVFCVHPYSKRCSLEMMVHLNEAIIAVGGPRNLLTSVAEPSIRKAKAAMESPKTQLVSATGGGGVVRAALASGKKVIAAGPGNPPVIVDETADLEKAARDVVVGAAFDNNIPCVAEKILIALDPIAEPLVRAMRNHRAVLVSGPDERRLTELVVKEGEMNREYIGKDATVILRDAGIDAPRDTLLALIDVDKDHPLVQHEQLMPVLPLVRVRTFEQAVEVAVEVEHGFQHTAVIHSRDVMRITQFARAIGTTIFVANAPSYAWVGLEGEGWLSMTVSGPTGEGITSPRSFVRQRHLVYAGGMLGIR
ncbi:MAG TPA: aldehyde dehydrogenase family protein, partial [Armatimonadetes bacterium]|nr:aldehyde dehydrogenase family protein [Armatimonadota bacterium]